MSEAVGRWDTAYEAKAVTVLSLAFGLVGLDRWIITPLFPFIMKDLHLDYGQVGALVGVTAVFWGVAAIVMGPVSDRIGRRWVLIPSILLFSAFAGLTGLAGGFGMLMMLRAVMGVTEGAFTPPSVASTAEASHPTRRGLNQGLQLSLFALVGLGLGPIIATQLLKVVPSWRYVFLAVSVPGFVLAAIMAALLREPKRGVREAHGGAARWRDLLRSRNVSLALLGILCAMCCVFVIGGLMPNYLVDHLRLTPSQMGFVMSAVGFGGFLGEFVIPGLSDVYGRRPLAIASFLLGAILVAGFRRIGADPLLLFAGLFLIGFFCLGLLALFTGPVPTEAVNPLMIATAIGLVSGSGEVFGGGIAPTLAGWIAKTYGIQHVLDLALGGMVAGLVVSVFLVESAPRVLQRRLGSAATDGRSQGA